jgi:uncharacterized RmlC-like cupin family protein
MTQQMQRTMVVLLALFAMPARLGAAEESKGVALAPDAVRWREMSAKAPGVMIAEISGESSKGAWSGFVRFPAGSKSGLHTHSSEMQIVIVRGTWRYGPTSETERSFGPGSYILIPAGLPHTNSQPEEVLMFIQQSGKFDNLPAVASAR